VGGGHGQVFLTDEQVQKFGIASDHVVKKEELAEFLEAQRAVDISFDQTGRMEQIEV